MEKITLELKSHKLNGYFSDNFSKKLLIVFHGFSGNSIEFFPVFNHSIGNYNILLIDLPGFGESSFEEGIGYNELVLTEILHELFSLFTNYEKFLYGYSMGGRILLSYISRFKSYNFSGIILESSSPGIKDNKQRAERVAHDKTLADNILQYGISWFVDFWISQPMFESLKNTLSTENFVLYKNQKLTNNPSVLANYLNNFGTGKMNSCWESLNEIKEKTCLISGQLDKKFVELNLIMSSIIPNSENHIIEKAGHNIHIENPQKIAEIIKNFLK